MQQKEQRSFTLTLTTNPNYKSDPLVSTIQEKKDNYPDAKITKISFEKKNEVSSDGERERKHRRGRNNGGGQSES